MTNYKNFKYRLYPTQSQERQMLKIIEYCRHWYNMCIDERRWAWEAEGRSVSKFDQYKTAIHYRHTFQLKGLIYSSVLRDVCNTMDEAFKAFFRRVKAGDKAGFPRYKSRKHFDGFGFPQFDGFKIDGRRLRLYGVGRVRVRWHRPIEGKIKTLRVFRRANQWFAVFTAEVVVPEPLPKTHRAIGIDVGVTALITTSDGDKVTNPNYYHKSQKQLRILNRSLARKQRGGKNRRKALLRLQRHQTHIANQRSDFLSKLSRELILKYDLIALEDLKIGNMVRNTHLSKSILDSGWGQFKSYLAVKAIDTGRQIVFVNPKYTSKTCSNCGAIFEKLTLKDRWVMCECGLSLDRDHNAAINILNRALT